LVHLVVIQVDHRDHLFDHLQQVLSIHNRPSPIHAVDRFCQDKPVNINHLDHEHIMKVLFRIKTIYCYRQGCSCHQGCLSFLGLPSMLLFLIDLSTFFLFKRYLMNFSISFSEDLSIHSIQLVVQSCRTIGKILNCSFYSNFIEHIFLFSHSFWNLL
jgi:hypothetical protein